MRVASVAMMVLVGLVHQTARAQDGDAPAASPEPVVAPQPDEVVEPPAEPAVAAADLPKPAALVDRYLEAVGGRERYFAQTNRITQGTSLTDPGGAFSLISLWQSRDNRMRLRREKPGATWMDLYYADDVGWLVDGNGRVALLGGAVVLDLADSADFFSYGDPEHRYESLVTTGIETFDDRQAYAVAGRSIYHKDETLYFDAKTGLLLGLKTIQTTGEGVKPITMLLQEYKAFDGVLIPTRVIQSTEDGSTTLRFSKIRVNVKNFDAIEVPEIVAKRVEQLRLDNEAAQDEPDPSEDPGTDPTGDQPPAGAPGG